ncbi:MAG: hypothetical protein WD226_09925 [Planctomycetota bacterium]
MKPIHAFASIALVASALPTAAQVGEPFPMDAQVEVLHPAAKTLDAFRGRTILVEFFAHW